LSPAPKLNLSSLKKKAAAARSRQNHQHHQQHVQQPRTMIIPPTVIELDECERSSNGNPGNINKIDSENDAVQNSPKISLHRMNSHQPTGMPAPDIHPPAYSPSYAPPPGFIDHSTSNINLMAHSQHSQTHIQYPPPSSGHIQHTQAFARQVQYEASPHAAYNGPLSTPLRSSQSQPHPQAGMYHHPNAHEHTNVHQFERPLTPLPRSGEREREKRGSTIESDVEREREMEIYRGKSKRVRLQFGEADMGVSPTFPTLRNSSYTLLNRGHPILILIPARMRIQTLKHQHQPPPLDTEVHTKIPLIHPILCKYRTQT
jgi:hypothetical protein